jgi:hypothetical protein
LNAWDARALQPGSRSRGLLVRDLLDARDILAALARLEREELACYRGFTLVLFEPGRPPAARAWDGATLETPAPRSPLCSSSLDRGRAQAERERVYARLMGPRPPESGRLGAFHASHEPERGPWSPCMHRPDAATVSASEIRVEGEIVALRYAPGPPCTTAFGPWLELERAR